MASVLDPCDVPELSALLEEAIGTFLRSRRFVCRHAFRPGAVLFLCAQHPLIGLRCSDCMPDHLDRHDPVEEHTCDCCRERSETIGGVVLRTTFSAPVREARGRQGLLAGQLFVGGLGLCLGCVPGRAAA